MKIIEAKYLLLSNINDFHSSLAPTVELGSQWPY
jgi:hypothetical protein